MNLFDKGGSNVLTLDTSKEINRGGEGAIYLHPKNPKQVLKIYHPHIKSQLNPGFMGELSGLPNNFIRPIDVFYDAKGKPVGFSMQYLDTNKLHLFTDLSTKAVCLKEGFDDTFREGVLHATSELLVKAHNCGVVIGDLNPYNIYFSKAQEVMFIDTDSYQTKSKKHSGVMLPEIRDWKNFKVDDKSDFFSFAVLCFQASTFVHPYKGIHKTIKSLEERVVKNLSLLSGDKDLIIPKFYQPVVNSKITNQFFEIFQKDSRYLVDITGMHSTKSVPRPQATNIILEGSLSIKLLCDSVATFGCSDGFYYLSLIGSPRHWQLYEALGKQMTKSIIEAKADRVIATDNGFIFDIGGSLRYLRGTLNESMNNVSYNPSTDVVLEVSGPKNQGTMVIFDTQRDTYTIVNTSSMVGSRASSDRGNIFVASVAVKQGAAIQTISGMKWILSFNSGFIQTIRTPHDIRDVIKYGDIMILKIKKGNAMKHYLARQVGLMVDLGAELDDMRQFTVSGTNIFVPEDGKIDVYSAVGLQKVAEIQCSYVTEQSVLKQCKAGILCQTDERLYLLNKS